jgi:iron(III) transport system ATP-binding protein
MANDDNAHAAGLGRKPYLKIEGVTKRFGDFTALNGIALDVYESEFVCFLGPSGCGKTTLLRAIAGLDIQTTGRIEQAGRDISDLPVSHRDFGIVFQSYALFPNLTVFKNVAYGLENRKMPKGDIVRRVEELLALVGMSGHTKKYPAQLSGGEQQRIALARALATSPGLLLLDEPLSALDAKVRVHLRHEVKQLQHQLGVTTIMVTHDQEEALTMADRIVVMNHGVIEQVGTPQEIYGAPTSPFVADFVGTMNFLPGVATDGGGVQLGGVELAIEHGADGFTTGTPVTVCVRPEDVATRDIGEATANKVETTVTGIEFLGSFYRASLAVKGTEGTVFRADLSVNLVREMGVEEGQPLSVAFPEDRIRVFAAS